MDPLSNVLSLLKPRSHVSGRFDIGSRQAILFPEYQGIKCYAVIEGACWLTVTDADQVLLREGDCSSFQVGGASRWRRIAEYVPSSCTSSRGSVQGGSPEFTSESPRARWRAATSCWVVNRAHSQSSSFLLSCATKAIGFLPAIAIFVGMIRCRSEFRTSYGASSTTLFTVALPPRLSFPQDQSSIHSVK